MDFKSRAFPTWSKTISRVEEELSIFKYEKRRAYSVSEADILYQEIKEKPLSLGLDNIKCGQPNIIASGTHWSKVARPDEEVIDIDGDGSFLMNVQELATAKIEKINAKCLLLNNQHLGMVVQWEDRFYESMRGHTILCDPKNIGGPDNLDAIYPDYIKMCEGFRGKSQKGY